LIFDSPALSSGLSEAERHGLRPSLSIFIKPCAVWKVLSKPLAEGYGDLHKRFSSVLGFFFMATCLLLTLGLRILIQTLLSFEPPQLERSVWARRRERW
jgi:hypothetical protein